MKDRMVFKKTFYKTYHKKFVLPTIFKGNNYYDFKQSRPEAYHEYRKKWSEVPNKRIITDFPMHISIATNNLCNLKCPMCPRAYGYTLTDGNPTISLDRFKKIIDEGANYGLMALRLNKQNEPTLTKNISEYISYAKEKGVLDVMINTNAVKLNRTMGEKLILSGLDKINISVDSHRKDLYDKIRVGAKLEKVAENIRGFFGLREELKSITPLICISRVTKSTDVHELAPFCDYFKDYCDIITASNWVDYSITPDLFDKMEISEDLVFQELGTCLQPFQRIEIDAYGNAYCCCMELGENKLGNIYEHSLYNLWHCKKMKGFREMVSNNKHLSLSSCSKCYAGTFFSDVNSEELNHRINTENETFK